MMKVMWITDGYVQVHAYFKSSGGIVYNGDSSIQNY